MVEIIRNKWCDDLEDLLQCPICMVRPRTWIFQCVQGHHICEDCKSQLGMCPTCSQSWSPARNRLAESLCTKLDDIKLSLIDPEGEVNKLLIPDRVSVASQTEGEVAVAGSLVAKPADDEPSGAYHCRIGGCSVQLFYAPLLQHIGKDHSSQYIEIPTEGNVFQNIWFFEFVEQMTFDRAFTVPSMGTFFLKLSSDVFGNFTGFVLMLHNGFVSKQFTYQLEIACCAEHTTSMSYTGEMCSCRTPSGVLREKSLNIKRPDIQRMLEHKKNLTCTVLVSKNSFKNEDGPQQKPAYVKKTWPKKKNNAARQENLQNGASATNQRNSRPRTAPNGRSGQQSSRDSSRQSGINPPNVAYNLPPLLGHRPPPNMYNMPPNHPNF